MPKNDADDRLSSEAKAFKQRLDILLACGRVADAIRYLDKYSRNGQLSITNTFSIDSIMRPVFSP